MKKAFTIFVLSLCCLSLISQDTDFEPLQFDTIVNVANKSKTDLFNSLRAWVAEGYVSANDVVQYENSEEGKIVVKGSFNFKEDDIWYYYNGRIRHTLILQTKDGKIRITHKDFIHKAEHYKSPYSFGLLYNSFEHYQFTLTSEKKTNKMYTDIVNSLRAFVLVNQFSIIEAANESFETDDW